MIHSLPNEACWDLHGLATGKLSAIYPSAPDPTGASVAVIRAEGELQAIDQLMAELTSEMLGTTEK